MGIFNTLRDEYEESLPVYEGCYDFETDGYVDAFMESYEDDLAVMEAMHEYDMLELMLESKKKKDDDDEDDEEDDADEEDDEEEDDEDDEKKSTKEATGVPEGNTPDGDADVSDSLAAGYNQLIDGSSSKSALKEAMGESAKNIWGKIKAGLEKLWAKLKDYFNQAIMFFSRFVKSGTDFAKKYSKELSGLNVSGMKVEMYDYSKLDSVKVHEAMAVSAIKDRVAVIAQKAADAKSEEDINKLMEEIKNTTSDESGNKMRGEMASDIIPGFPSASINASDFKKEVHKYLRGGMEEPKEMEVNMSQILSELQGAATVKAAKGAIANLDKDFKHASQIVKAAANKAKAEDDKLSSKRSSVINKYISVFKQQKTIGVSIFSAWKDVIKERDSKYKSICVKAVSYSRKKNKGN